MLPSLVFVKQAGNEHIYRCPFCGDSPKRKRHGHLYVNFQEGVYYCHRCHQAGRIDELGFDLPVKDNWREPEITLPEIERRHRVYSKLLSLLTLHPRHREDLKRRGMSDEEIEKRRYRSLPDNPKEAQEILTKLKSEFFLKDIPGFDPPAFFLAPGYLIPVRSETGKIQGFQIRRDSPFKLTPYEEGEITITCNGSSFAVTCPSGKPRFKNRVYVPILEPGRTVELRVYHDDIDEITVKGPAVIGNYPKYCWFSCQGKMKSAPHFTPGNGEVLWITEGALKADIFNAFTQRRTIGLPGTGTWKLLKTRLRFLKAREVIVAFDSEDNPYTGQEARNLAAFCKENGYSVWMANWPSELGKGVDDILANGYDPEKFLKKFVQ